MDENKKQTVIFDKQTSYNLGGTKYIVVSHFSDEGENIIDKIVRLLKTDMQNTVSQNM